MDKLSKKIMKFMRTRGKNTEFTCSLEKIGIIAVIAHCENYLREFVIQKPILFPQSNGLPMKAG